MPAEQVLRFKEMTEAGFAAAGAANRHDFLPVLRLLDFGRTAKRLAALAKARHRFGQSLIDEYRRRHPRGAPAQETPRTVIGDLLRQQQEGSPEPLDDVVIRTVCLVSHTRSWRRHTLPHGDDLQSARRAGRRWKIQRSL